MFYGEILVNPNKFFKTTKLYVTMSFKNHTKIIVVNTIQFWVNLAIFKTT